MSAPAANTEDLLVLGKISGAHGIRGEVKVHSFTEPRENILLYQPLFLQRAADVHLVEVLGAKLLAKALIVRLKGVFDRDTALELTGCTLVVAKGQLPVLPLGEYYWHQLEGLRVINLQGELLGLVDHLLETGANDVLVVRPCTGSLDTRMRLLPYTDQAIRQIDLVIQEIRVDWDAGF